MRRHITYANVASTMALVFAMAGGAFAAGVVPKNSVNSRSIKNNSIISADVKDKSLRAKDFRNGELPAGPTGATGAVGAAGSAKAYGFVNRDGTVDASRSSTNLSARLAIDPGVYCVKAAGVSIKTAVVSMVSSSSNNSDGDNEWGLIDWERPGNATNLCNADEMMVRAFYVITPGPNVTFDNVDFSVIIE